jgi:integrase
MNMTIDDFSRITPDIIIDRFRQIEKDFGSMAAKNVFGKLQAIMNYARVRYPSFVQVNPCQCLTSGKLWPKTNSRDDCLKGNDFKLFHDGIQGFNEATRDAFLFCLYHGLRNMEAASLKWDYVDLEGQTLTIPSTVTKTKRPLHVPLSRQSLAILKRRKETRGEEQSFVFPTVRDYLNKTGHIVLKSDALKLKTGLDISPHGLRRTFITIGEKLKLRRQDIDKLTNHVDRSVTATHYDRTDVDDLREPLQRIASEVERLMFEGVGAKVIQHPASQEMK